MMQGQPQKNFTNSERAQSSAIRNRVIPFTRPEQCVMQKLDGTRCTNRGIPPATCGRYLCAECAGAVADAFAERGVFPGGGAA